MRCSALLADGRWPNVKVKVKVASRTADLHDEAAPVATFAAPVEQSAPPPTPSAPHQVLVVLSSWEIRPDGTARPLTSIRVPSFSGSPAAPSRRPSRRVTRAG